MSPAEVRRGVLVLSSHVGWPLSEIMNLPTSQWAWWLDGLPKQKPPKK